MATGANPVRFFGGLPQKDMMHKAIQKSLLPDIFGRTAPGFYDQLVRIFLCPKGGSRYYFPGEVILEQDAESDGLVILEQGDVAISQSSGNESWQQSCIAIFGEVNLLLSNLPTWPIRVDAVTRCKVTRISAHEIFEMVDGHHGVQDHMEAKARLLHHLREQSLFEKSRLLFLATICAKAQRIVLNYGQVLWKKGHKTRGIALVIRGALNSMLTDTEELEPQQTDGSLRTPKDPHSHPPPQKDNDESKSVVGLEECIVGKIMSGQMISKLGGIGLSTHTETTIISAESDTLVMETGVKCLWETLAHPLFQTERACFIELANSKLRSIISAEGNPLLATDVTFLKNVNVSPEFITFLRKQYDTTPTLVIPLDPICVQGADGRSMHVIIHGLAKAESGKVPCSAMTAAMEQHPEDAIKLKSLICKLIENVDRPTLRALLRKIPILMAWTEEAVDVIADRMHSSLYVYGEFICKQDQVTGMHTMYVIESGVVEVIVNREKVGELGSGQSIGEIGVMGLTQKRTATLRCATMVRCFCVRQSDLSAALSQFPHYRGSLRKYAHDLFNSGAGPSANRGIATAEMFCFCNERFLYLLELFSTNSIYLPQDVLIKEGSQHNSDLLYIKQGICVVRTKGRTIAELKAGSLFGEMMMLGLVDRRTVTVTAISCVYCQVLTKESFMNALKECPEEIDYFRDLGIRRRVENFCRDTFALRELRFFSHCSEAFAQQLRQVLKPFMHLANASIMTEGAVGTTCQILYDGTADVIVDGQKVDQLEAGCVFGELCALGLTSRIAATVVATTPCFVHIVDRAELAAILDRFPEEKAGCIAKVAKERRLWLDRIFRTGVFTFFYGSHATDDFTRDLLDLDGKVCIYNADEVIHSKGTAPAMFYLLLSGTVEIRSMGILVNVLEKGAGFGEIAVLTPGADCGEYVCVCDDSEILAVDADGFRTVLDKFPDVLSKVAKTAYDRKWDLEYTHRKLRHVEDKQFRELHESHLHLVDDTHFPRHARFGERDLWNMIMEVNVVAEDCLAKCVLHHFNPGELVFDASIHELGLLFVRDGILDCKADSPAGKKQIVGHVRPGSIHGEVICLSGTRRGMYALYAPMVGKCSCFFLKRRYLRNVLHQNLTDPDLPFHETYDRICQLLPSREENGELLRAPGGPLADLNPEVTKLMAIYSSVTKFDPGDVIVESGSFDDNLYVVEDGALHVIDSASKETFEVLYHMASFGGVNLLGTESRHTATLMAPKDDAKHTTVRIIRKRDFFGALWFYPVLWKETSKWLRLWKGEQLKVHAKLVQRWHTLKVRIGSMKPNAKDVEISTWKKLNEDEHRTSKFLRCLLRGDDFSLMIDSSDAIKDASSRKSSSSPHQSLARTSSPRTSRPLVSPLAARRALPLLPLSPSESHRSKVESLSNRSDAKRRSSTPPPKSLLNAPTNIRGRSPKNKRRVVDDGPNAPQTVTPEVTAVTSHFQNKTAGGNVYKQGSMPKKRAVRGRGKKTNGLGQGTILSLHL
eukprot:GEMP01002360.1.p1 GENE.GEMP01002360.1~~GEMP01002360.1.p1  ORF type:complete len:1502 (+),score=332.64 GEMP01002360.1:161-4666(+)